MMNNIIIGKYKIIIDGTEKSDCLHISRTDLEEMTVNTTNHINQKRSYKEIFLHIWIDKETTEK